MKRRFFYFIILLFTSLTSCGQYIDFLAPRQFNYYLHIGGQSNAVGLAANPSDYGLTGVIPNAYIKDNGFGGTYEPLEFGVNNQGNDATKFGVELSLGKYLGQRHGPVYLSKYAVNGAALAEVPGGNDFHPGGTQYNNMIGVIDEAVDDLPVSSIPYLKILVWIQGERDGQGETGQPTIYSSVYAENFLEFKSEMEIDLGFEWDMIIICRLSENQRLGYLSTVTGFDQVVTQQNAIVVGGGSRYRLVNMDNFYTNPTDAAHYLNHGANFGGIDIAKTILGETITPIASDPSWTPAQYSGCKLWLDGKQGVTLTSGKVSQWNDQSGNSRHATQSNASLRPTYNGTDAVVFNADGFLDLSAWIASFNSDTQGEIILVVERTNTATPTDWIVSFSSTASDNSFYSIFIRPSASSNPDRVWSYKQNGVGAGSQLYDADVIPSSDLIISVANNTYGYKIWQNSSHEDLVSASFGNVNETNWLDNFTADHTNLTVGGLVRQSGNLLSKVSVRSVIYFDHMLKYEERQALNTFLNNYYFP